MFKKNVLNYSCIRKYLELKVPGVYFKIIKNHFIINIAVEIIFVKNVFIFKLLYLTC